MSRTLLLIALLATATAHAQNPDAVPPPAQAEAPFSSSIVPFHAGDGTPLEGRLTLPTSPSPSPLPAVLYLHGAGPRTYSSAYAYRGPDGTPAIGHFLDHHAEQLARRGIAMFAISKRGCTAIDELPGMKVDREIYGAATLTQFVDDYQQALRVLREMPEIDPARIVLVGSSEGTRAAPLLAARAPDGIAGLVLMAYAPDNARDTVVWQSTIGPWRNIQHLIPAARDGELTRAEHEAFAKESPTNAQIAAALPFDTFDVDKTGVMTADDLAALNAPRLDALLKACETGDDEMLWRHLGRTTSAYLRDWWEAEPTVQLLLPLDVPIGIFHGDLDGTCRIEGVHETRDAFAAADKHNLTVFLYPDANHDLNWTPAAVAGGGPQPYTDAFDFIARLVAKP